jgi:prephenate dehydrogenase
MMAEISIAILGLGRIGTSIGMALKRYNKKNDATHRFTITGYTNNPEHIKTAQKQDAVHDIARNAGNAAAGRDIVLIAMPYAEIEGTYQYISQDLRPGVVVIDCSPLKQPSLAWAKKHLPAEAHMVGVTPILNPNYLFEGVDNPERASADYFDGGQWLIVPGLTAIPEAIELARDFASIVGAQSRFIDPAENDSLVAATEHLPALIGLAYYYMLEKNQGWGDVQKLTNPAFGMLTRHLYDTHPDDLRDQWLAGRDNLVRNIDELMNTLRILRRALAENDATTVEGAASSSAASYEAWYNRRVKNQWDKLAKPIDAPDFLTSIFGGTIANRLRGTQDDDN